MDKIYFNSFLMCNQSKIGTVKSLLDCLTDKLVNYLSRNVSEFKYNREPDSNMKKELNF